MINLVNLVWPSDLWTFSIVSGQRLDGKVFCQQLRVVLHPHSILHHGHHPPWLGIRSATTPGLLRTPQFWEESSSPSTLYTTRKPLRHLFCPVSPQLREACSAPEQTCNKNSREVISLSLCFSGGGSSFLLTPVLNGGGQILPELFRVKVKRPSAWFFLLLFYCIQPTP